VLFALALHAVGILSFGFTQANHHKASTIEVTLAKLETQQRDEQADFYAAINQRGSGESEQVKQLSEVQSNAQDSPSDSLSATQLKSDTHREQAEKSQQSADPATAEFELLISTESAHRYALKEQTQADQSTAKTGQPLSRSEEIVALHSQITLRRQLLAKSPITRTITTMSTKSHQDAAYLENWRKRIVTVGNIHYPTAANEHKMYGRVRLLIAMQANGLVKSVEILESSGKKLLDSSAIKIIHLAQPFAPFSEQMRQNTDILEIIRTIEFEKRTLIY